MAKYFFVVKNGRIQQCFILMCSDVFRVELLTASEARAMDAGTAGGGVQVSIGSVTIGGGLSTWDIAVQIAQELERAAVAAAPR